MTDNQRAALNGSLLLLPPALMAAIAGFEIEPWDSFFGQAFTSDGFTTNTFGFAVQIALMLLMPAALAVVVWPMLRTGADGTRKLYPINFILGAAIFIVIALFISGLIADQYPCWVGVPNCD